jgi:hypothetical protein
MLRFGFASIRSSIVFPSILLLTSFCVSLYYLALRFQIPILLAAACPFLSVLPSGFGFLRILVNVSRTARMNDYVSQSGARKIRRFHPVFHILFSFRPTLLSLPLVTGTIYLLFWSLKFRHNTNKFMLPAVGFVCGIVLPAVQHQSFIAFIVFFAVFAAMRFFSDDFSKEMRGFAVMFGVGFLPHIPRFLDTAFLSCLFRGRSPFDGNFIANWWNDCGLFLVVICTLGWFCLNPIEFNLWVPAFATIVVFTIFRMQLEIVYNVFGFFVVVYPIGAIVFVVTVYRGVLAQTEPETKGVLTAIAALVTLSFTLSAVMGVTRQINLNRMAWGIAEDRLAEWIVKNTPKNAVFMSPLMALNPVSAIAGRSLYYECPDVMSHIGIDPSEREVEFHTFTNTNVSADVHKWVDYLVRGNDDPGLPENKWREVYFTRDFAIYENIR